MKRWIWIPLLALSLTGCATTPHRTPPLSQADVVSMVKAGVTDEEIIRRIDDTRTFFRLGADDVVRLRQEGVSDRVVNYMLDTYTRAAVSEQRRQDRLEYDLHYRWYYYGGYPYPYRWW